MSAADLIVGGEPSPHMHVGQPHHEPRQVSILRRPLGVRFEPDVELEIVEALRVRAVVGRTELRHHDADFGEPEQSLADLDTNVNARLVLDLLLLRLPRATLAVA